MNAAFNIKFITPLFSRGAYEDRPEIRAASIRGQLHWWFRALNGDASAERAVFGSVHQGFGGYKLAASASKVVVRVRHEPLHGEWIATLPHKPPGRSAQDGPNAPRIACPAGVTCELHILTRLGSIKHAEHQRLFDRTVETWLLLGTLGLRSTRACGSFQWEPLGKTQLHPPVNFDAYEVRCRQLLQGAPVRFALLEHVYTIAERARHDISDTLGGPTQTEDWSDLRALHWPLGDVASKPQQQQDSTRKERKTSPLRFRIVKAGGQFRIAALWDSRDQVTHNNTQTDLPGIIRLLKHKKPALGQQLAASELAK
jgi:hypothetical protein